MPIIPFSFDNQSIEFELNPKTLMVNATQMAKPFDKRIDNFLRTDETQNFINECLKPKNAQELGIETQDDLYNSIKGTGTWMHKRLALKFAAWLNPAFELWVYSIIEKLLIADYENHKKSLQETAKRRLKIEELKETLKDNKEFLELEKLREEDRSAIYNRSKMNQNQIKMFREIETNKGNANIDF